MSLGLLKKLQAAIWILSAGVVVSLAMTIATGIQQKKVEKEAAVPTIPMPAN